MGDRILKPNKKIMVGLIFFIAIFLQTGKVYALEENSYEEGDVASQILNEDYGKEQYLVESNSDITTRNENDVNVYFEENYVIDNNADLNQYSNDQNETAENVENIQEKNVDKITENEQKQDDENFPIIDNGDDVSSNDISNQSDNLIEDGLHLGAGDYWELYINGEFAYYYQGLYNFNGKDYYIQDGKWEPYNLPQVTLVEVDGTKYFLHNGVVDYGFTGAAEIQYCDSYEYNIVYITNGIFDSSYTGLAEYKNQNDNVIDYSWVYIENGIQNFEYTGLALYNGDYYYCEFGNINWSYTGIVEYYGQKYFVENGVLNWNYTGTYWSNEDGGYYCYFDHGVLSNDYTGLAQSNNDWMYFINGKQSYDYVGLVLHTDGNWYYVENGYINWYKTGLVEYYGVMYYVNNGVLDWSYNGFSEEWNNDDNTSSIYIVNNGQVNQSSNGLYYYSDYDQWGYYTNGKFDSTFNSLVYYQGVWYNVYNGYIDFYMRCLTEYQGVLYYVNNGVVDWNYTGIYNDWSNPTSGREAYYVINGAVNNSFSGYVQGHDYYYYGDTVTYEIINGKSSHFTGTKVVNGTPYLFIDGLFRDNSYELGYYADNYYAFYGGVLAPWYTGGISYYQNDNVYYVKNGIIDWTFNGFSKISYNDLYFAEGYFNNGQLVKTSNGLIDKGNGVFVLVNHDGLVQNNFSGLVKHTDGNYYYVSYGYIDFNYIGATSFGIYDYEEDMYFQSDNIVYWNVNKVDQNYTGMTYLDGYYWTKFINGVVDTSFNSLIFNSQDGQWHGFHNGIETFEDCIIFYNGKYYLTSNGIVNWNYNGLIGANLYDNVNDYTEWKYFYILNGELAVNLSTLVYDESYDSWINIVNGVQDYKENLVLFNGIWYYVADGEVNWYDEGVINYFGTVYHYKNGVVAWDYSGIVEDYYTTDEEIYHQKYYIVKNGVLDVASQLAYNNDINEWMYFNNGEQDNTYNGLCDYNGSWYYVNNGIIDWYYNGEVDYNGIKYFVENGIINWNFNDYVEIYDENLMDWIVRKYTNGYFDEQFTGVFENYYFIKGLVDTNYDGVVVYNGVFYNIKNGQLSYELDSTNMVNNDIYYFKNGIFDSSFTGVASTDSSMGYLSYKYFINGVDSKDFNGVIRRSVYRGNVLITEEFEFENGQCINYRQVNDNII